jgi:plasmid replication initiation protein
MKIKNKDVIQSYIVTAAKYDFNVYEKRIIYRLVEMCQAATEGQKLNANYRINPLVYENMKEIEMPISAFMKDEHDENYTRAKKALMSLNEKRMEYEDEKQWKQIRMIELPKLERGMAKFVLHKEVYQALLDFSKGFRKFELKTAMSFDSVYAMRFYELFSGKTEPITYKIEDLKIMFGVQEKYKLAGDFMRYVVGRAKKELDKKAPFSFEYKQEKVSGSKKIYALTFFPYLIPANRDEALEKRELQGKISLRWVMDRVYVDYLKQNYLFTNMEIRRNIETFQKASERLNFMDFLERKRRDAQQVKNPKGWIINAIKDELKKSGVA